MRSLCLALAVVFGFCKGAWAGSLPENLQFPPDMFTAQYDTTTTISVQHPQTAPQVEESLAKMGEELRKQGFKPDEVKRNLAIFRKDLERQAVPERVVVGAVVYTVKGPSDYRVTVLENGEQAIDEYTTGTLRLVRRGRADEVWLQPARSAAAVDEDLFLAIFRPLRAAAADPALVRSGIADDLVLVAGKRRGQEHAYRLTEDGRVALYQSADERTVDVSLEYDGEVAMPNSAVYTIRTDKGTTKVSYRRKRFEPSAPADLTQGFMPAYAMIADKRHKEQLNVDWEGGFDLPGIEAKLKEKRPAAVPKP